MHLKRQRAPKNWPVPRKGTVYIVRPNYNLQKGGIPVLIALRDILGLTKNRRETRKIIHSKLVLLNNRQIKDEKMNILLFDILKIVPSKINYRLTLSEKGKFNFEKVDEKESGYKVSKIVDKKILKGKKIQINLWDGRNSLCNLKCKINDSAIVNFDEKKIDKFLELKEKAKALVFGGKHAGKRGEIEKIDLEKKQVELKTKDKEKINVLIKQLMVIE